MPVDARMEPFRAGSRRRCEVCNFTHVKNCFCIFAYTAACICGSVSSGLLTLPRFFNDCVQRLSTELRAGPRARIRSVIPQRFLHTS